MMTIDDMRDVTGLSREEVSQLAGHDHLADIAAALLGEYFMHMHKGASEVQRMICGDMREALRARNLDHARVLFTTLQDFLDEYPETLHPEALRPETLRRVATA